MAEENFDIFSDFQEQDFANSQEYFDYLTKQSEDYRDFATNPEKVKKDRETFFNQTTDLLKVVPNMGAETANLLIDILELPVDIYSAVAGDEGDVGGFGANIAEQRFPRVPELEYSNPNMGYVDKTAAFLVGSPLAFIKGLDLLANKSPKAYKAMREMYPYSVGQMHDSFKTKGFIKGLADIFPKPETSEALARNLVLIGATGLGGMYSSGDPANKPQPVDMPVEAPVGSLENPKVLDKSTIDYRDYADILPGGMAEMIGKQGAPGLSMGGEPGLESNIFEESSEVVTDGPEEVQVANLFGKTPIWAIANAEKAKTLTQDFSKAVKQAMESIKNKLGTKDEVLGETVEDIDIIDTPSGGTTVGAVKNKKTIIDSPELNESVFYSNLEARLMDPNTPKTFKSADEFYAFLQNKQISKPELEDNILNRYVEISGKNKTPLVTSDMLEIVRQSPMRHIDSVTYGDAAYGGTKSAKYGGGHYEPGEIPGSYREDVLYVPANKIPLDPDSLPSSGHDFEERYVIGWSRLTDRKATLPVEKTAQGIEEAIDPKMINTLKKNQKTLDRQLKGLETSALRKLEREGLVDIDDVDNLTMAEIRNVLNEGDNMARLNSIDPALEQQILQFRMKIEEDALKLQNIEAATKGQQVTVTFADEIQSDILQQAKRLEEKFKEQLGDLMDKNIDFVKEQIRTSQRGYRGDFRDMNPEVAEYFLRNKSVFRPIFQSATEMQQFMNEYAKTQLILQDLAKAGLRPDKQLVIKAREARIKQHKMLQDLETAMSKESLKKLFPNVPFKNRMEWGSALIKRDLAKAANRLYGADKVEGAAEWYAISPGTKITNRYNQSGGTNTPHTERTSNMKGIGTEEFYGGPDSVDPNGKHYTSTLEKILRKAAKENNSEIKVIDVNGVGKSFAIKITPEMLLPHKTHRKKGGMVYTPEIIDIFEAA